MRMTRQHGSNNIHENKQQHYRTFAREGASPKLATASDLVKNLKGEEEKLRYFVVSGVFVEDGIDTSTNRTNKDIVPAGLHGNGKTQKYLAQLNTANKYKRAGGSSTCVTLVLSLRIIPG